MTEHEQEDGFEAFVQRAASSYHKPPADVPRDEMWSAIAKQRGVKRPTYRLAPWLSMAATLLIGVGIGKFVLSGSPTATAPAAVTASSAPVTPAPAIPSAPEIPGTASSDPQPGAGPRRVPVIQAASAVRTAADRNGANDLDAVDASYQVASRQHLTRAEALVAVVAATPEDAMMDSLTSKWARDILTNTRLLLDSPAGEDPTRRRLLEDLETVLVQLVQRSGRVSEDRQMIDRTLQRTQLLTRLRSGAAGT